jgi:putative sterol carrier protein
MRFRPEAAVDGTYEIRFVGGEVISLAVRDGELTAIRGEAEEPKLVVEGEPTALHELIEGVSDAETAVAAGHVRLHQGSVEELATLAQMFAPVAAPAAAAAAA